MQQKALSLMQFQKSIRGIHHGVSPKHLPRYLVEFCHRFNRRWEPQMFNRMLHACLKSDIFLIHYQDSVNRSFVNLCCSW
jgi:hypothetical protein